MTASEILEELRPLGGAGYKRVLFNHGVREPCFGVKISELQRFVKRIRKNHPLALDLYDTGNYDAMYLAGLIADDARMTRENLQNWVSKAYCRGLCGATVPWVAAGSPHGWELALEWIESSTPLIATAGWATLGSLVSIRPDPDLDLPALTRLLDRVETRIHREPADPVRYQMNSFLIAVGSHVAPLSERALQAGERIGPVTADLGNNACEVPSSPDAIRKVSARGAIGKKRKSAKC
jgi:hypothetical protein